MLRKLATTTAAAAAALTLSGCAALPFVSAAADDTALSTDIDCATADVDGPCGYGDDARLDALWDACADGDGAACDDLYYTSPFGSAYEAFGNTCGDRGFEFSCD